MVPISYSYRSLIVRWKTTLMTASGFTLVVAALIVMLAFIKGIEAICAISGEPENVLVLSQGNSDEVVSSIGRDLAVQVENTPGVSRDYSGQPIASRELYMVVNYFPKGAVDYSFLQVRGITPMAFSAHSHVKLVSGQKARPGQSEVIIGKAAQRELGLKLGDYLEMGRKRWRVAGIFSANGSAFETEIWCDLNELASQFRREGVVSTVVLRAPDGAAADRLAAKLKESRQISVEAMTETKYYAKQAEGTKMLQSAAWVIASFMAVGAVFGVMNTMFAAIGQRIKDIAVLRIMGFMAHEILLSFLLESLLIAMIGGMLGAGIGYLTNGLTQSAGIGARQVEFAFTVDGEMLLGAAIFSFIMGVLGGIIPALSAMRIKPLEALR
ncbi:MAG: ABC transporter permease [Planctomycetota bacterium]